MATAQGITRAPSTAKPPSEVKQSADQIFGTYRRRRLAILGSTSVGKTSMTNRFVYGSLEGKHAPTIEDEHHRPFEVESTKYWLEIVDTGGQDPFTQMALHVTLGMHGYLLLFSVDNENSFNVIKTVDEKLMHNLGAESSEVKRILVGNKVDKASRRKVPVSTARAYARQQGIPYMECSAKTGENVTDIFTKLINIIEGRKNVSQTQGYSCTIQ